MRHKLQTIILLIVLILNIFTLSSYATQIGSLTSSDSDTQFDSVDGNNTEQTPITDNIEQEYSKEFNIEVVGNEVISADEVDIDDSFDESDVEGESVGDVLVTDPNKVELIGDEHLFSYYIHNQSDVDGLLISELTITVNGDVGSQMPVLHEYYTTIYSDDPWSSDTNTETYYLSSQKIAASKKTGIVFGIELFEGHYTVHGRLRCVFIPEQDNFDYLAFDRPEGRRSNILDTDENNTSLNQDEWTSLTFTLLSYNNEQEISIPYGETILDKLPAIPDKELETLKCFNIDNVEVTANTLAKTDKTINTVYKSKCILPGPKFNEVLKKCVAEHIQAGTLFDFRYTYDIYDNILPANPANRIYDISEAEDLSSILLYNQEDNTICLVSKYRDIYYNTDSSYMFSGITSLRKALLGYADKQPITKHVTNLHGLFADCTNLIEVDLSKFNTTSLEYCGAMFYQCVNIPSVNLSNFVTPNLKHTYTMFFQCDKLQSINIMNMTTVNCTDMHNMFDRCYVLTDLKYDKTKLLTDNCEDLTAFFANCKLMTTFDVTNFRTSKCTNMQALFRDCINLKTIDLSSFDTSNVIYFQFMFNGCQSLKTLDLRSFDMRKADSCSYMFNGAFILKDIQINTNQFILSKVTNARYMFCNCYELTQLDVSKFDMSSCVNTDFMFHGCKKLSTLDVSKWNTSNFRNCDYMFKECHMLKALDVASWNMNNAVKLGHMFQQCYELVTCDTSNWAPARLESIAAMFHECRKLTYINCNKFNTSNVQSFASTFGNCWAATSIVCTAWDTSNATDLSYLFDQCKTVKTIDCHLWNTAKCVNMNNMFSDMISCTSINVTGFNTSNVTVMSYMFDRNQCTTLDLSSFDTRRCTNFCEMFYKNTADVKYSSILFGTNFLPSAGTNFSRMLYNSSVRPPRAQWPGTWASDGTYTK